MIRRIFVFGITFLMSVMGFAMADDYTYSAKDSDIYSSQVEESLSNYNKMYSEGTEVSLDEASSFVVKTADVSEAFYYQNIDGYLVIGHNEGKSLSDMALSERYIAFPSYNDKGYAMSVVYKYDEKNGSYTLDMTSVSADPEAGYTLCASFINEYAKKTGEEIKSVNVYYSTLYNMYLVAIEGAENNYIVPAYYLTKQVKISDWFPFESGTVLTEKEFFSKMEEYYDEEYTRDAAQSSSEQTYGAGVYHREDVESLGLREKLDASNVNGVEVAASVEQPKGKAQSAAQTAVANSNVSAKASESFPAKRVMIYLLLAVGIVGAEVLYLFKTRKDK